MPRAIARNESLPFQSIDQTRDIRRAFDHSCCNFASRMTVRMHAAKNTQHVVLCSGNTVSLAEMLQSFANVTCSNKHVNQCFLKWIGDLLLLQALAKRF